MESRLYFLDDAPDSRVTQLPLQPAQIIASQSPRRVLESSHLRYETKPNPDPYLGDSRP